MNCPLCGKRCRKARVTNLAQQDEYYCPTQVTFRTTPKDWAELHIQKSYHYFYDPIIEETIVDIPPYRFCLGDHDVLACHFKGVAGMQFETIFKTPKLEVNPENIQRLLKRIKNLVIFS